MRRTTRRADRRIATSAFIPAAGVALVVVVWVAAARLVNAPIVLPGPTATIVALWDAVRDPAFLGHLTGTLLRAVGGFVAAYLAGLAWGVIGATRPRIGRLLHPALVFIRATPVIAVILLALIWFRSSVAPLFVTLLMVLPLVVANVVSGVHAASGALSEMAESFSVSSRRRIRELTLPALRPYLLAAAHAGIGMAFKVTVAAEVLVQPTRALGGAMQEARFYLDTPRILALTLIVIALSALAEGALSAWERLFPGTIRFSGRRWRNGSSTTSVPAAEKERRVSLRRVARSYGTHRVLEDISIEFSGSEVAVVLGPSGCGKTTLLRLLGGLDEPDAGDIATGPSTAMVFQEPRLLPWADVGSNVGFVLDTDDRAQRVTSALHDAGLDVRPGRMPGSLSGGMQQRLALARALAYGSDTLLLDEPFQNLDLSLKLSLSGTVRDLTARHRLLTVMVTHDVVEALCAGDRIVILSGSPARVTGEERVTLSAADRDPRTASFQAEAGRLYELLLSPR